MKGVSALGEAGTKSAGSEGLVEREREDNFGLASAVAMAMDCRDSTASEQKRRNERRTERERETVPLKREMTSFQIPSLKRAPFSSTETCRIFSL